MPEKDVGGAASRRVGRLSTAGHIVRPPEPPRAGVRDCRGLRPRIDMARVCTPLQWTLDLATAAALFLVLGRQWLILPALIAEAIPGVAALPAWVLVVGSIALWERSRRVTALADREQAPRADQAGPSSRVISIIVSRNPSFRNSAWALAFRLAVMSTNRGAPRSLNRSLAPSTSAVATPRPRAASSTHTSWR